MKKIISYSLYNDRPKDVLNAIINCFLAKEIYKDWICRFYIDNTIPVFIKEALLTFDNVEVVEMDRHTDSSAMMWRFLPASDNDVDVMISRDADSWLSYREFVCVEDFLKSDKQLHIIRDHCYHSQKIMGGMWGVKKGLIEDIGTMINEYKVNSSYDQGFLADTIYTKYIDTALIHLGDQYNNSGSKANYFSDGGIDIPNYSDIKIDNFDFEKIHEMNKFHCAHCQKSHGTFIGAILEHIPKETLIILKEYFTKYNIETSMIDSFL